MKRLILLACLSVAVIACGATSGGNVAATVDGTELTVSDVEGVPFEASGTMGTDEFAQYLTALIQWTVLEEAAAEEFDIDPTDEDVDAKLDEILASQPEGSSLDELAESQGLSSETLRRILRVNVIQEQLAEQLAGTEGEPTQDEVDAAMDEQLANLTEVCARHVLVETADEAEEARGRLEAGESFEDVAADMSTDPSAADNGGDLGCSAAGRYVPEFRDAAVTAEIDAISEPVQSQFGFHVVQVYERTDPPAEDQPNEDEVRQGLLQQAGAVALQEWFLAQFEEAEVSVSEEYGEWVLTPQPMVMPPSSGTTPSLPTPDSTAPSTPETTAGS